MKKNIGTTDRLIRLAIAIGLLVYAYVGKSWLAFGVSLFVFFEALMSWCAVYQILEKIAALGIDSKRVAERAVFIEDFIEEIL